MSERPQIILALTPLAERQVESLLFDADTPLEIVSSVVEADELLREARERGQVTVLLSPELSGLTPAHCERLRAGGTHLLGMALDRHEHDALGALGVDGVVEVTVSREELLALLPRGGAARTDAAAARKPTTAPAIGKPERKRDQGTIVAVLGARGAPGASELAASFAALSSRRWPTALLEVDALGGALATRLGVDPGDGSLLGLIRAMQAGEGALTELLGRWLVQRDGWPAVLLSPTEPDPLSELAKPGAMTAALGALAELFPLVVCDVGFMLTDPRGQPVHLHREALLGADAVLLVLGSREMQLHGGLRQLDLLLYVLGVPPERVRVVVNQVGGPSSADKTAITNTIAPHLATQGLGVDAWLTWDARAAKRAERQGKPIALSGPRSAYTRAVERLLDDLFVPTDTPKTRRRKRRFVAPVHNKAPQASEEVVWQR
jgi:Flp pilus assembly CpaE family ATPase